MTFKAKLLSLLIRWLGIAAPVAQAVEPKNPMKISAGALEKASRADDVIRPMFDLPALPAGVVPNPKMAMDNAAVAMTYANDTGGAMHFLGYPLLASLSQHSEYRSPTETLATEMTREWIDLKSTGDDDRSDVLAALVAEMDRLKVRELFKQAAENDGFFGRAMIYIDLGRPDDNRLPLVIDPRTIKKGQLQGFKCIEPMWTSPAQYNAIDPTAKDFYKPHGWYVMGKEIHATRLLTMISRPLPDMLKPAYNFGGISMTQLLRPYVESWQRTREAVSDVVHSFSLSGLKTDMESTLQGGSGDDLLSRAKLFNQMRDNRNLMVLDAGNGEEFFQFNTPLSGLDALQAQSQEQMAAPCHIPLIKMFGITPSGLNATSEGELKVFYDYVASMQQAIFTDALVAVLKVIQLHLFGEIYDDITFEYCPLEQMSELDQATIQKTKADTASVLIETGAVSVEEERQRIASDPHSGYNGLDAEDIPNAEGED